MSDLPSPPSSAIASPPPPGKAPSRPSMMDQMKATAAATAKRASVTAGEMATQASDAAATATASAKNAVVDMVRPEWYTPELEEALKRARAMLVEKVGAETAGTVEGSRKNSFVMNLSVLRAATAHLQVCWRERSGRRC